MSKLFSNGCSFLVTRPTDGVETFSSKILAEQLGYELFNIAMGGRGNDRISFTTKLWFEQNANMQDVFAVIGWTSTHRMDYVTNDGWKKGRIPNMDMTWRTWKIVDQIKFVKSCPGWDVDQNGSMRLVDHVLDLQNFFKLKKIPYVMFNALPPEWSRNAKDIDIMFNSIDRSRYFQIESSHLDFIQKNKFIVSPNDPHPSAHGHLEWAKLLKEFIYANNLRTI
jgi:hypothetical protein